MVTLLMLAIPLAAAHAAPITSIASGNWSAPSTWSSGVLPGPADDVRIDDGFVVTIDVAAVCASLTIGQGVSGVLRFESGTSRRLAVGGNVTIAAGGAFETAASGATTAHLLEVGGDLINRGTLDFSTSANAAGASIEFSGADSARFAGAGPITDVRTVTIDKDARDTPVDLALDHFTVQGSSGDAAGFLSLIQGTLRIGGTFALTNRLFATDAWVIPATAVLWLDNPSFSVVGRAGGGTLSGALRIDAGHFVVGDVADDVLATTAGAALTLNGGIVDVAGRLAPLAGSWSYTQTGGTLNVTTIANTGAPQAGFDLPAGSSFTMSGGVIALQQACTVAIGPRDYRNLASPVSITGGTLQVGNASSLSAQTFHLQGAAPNLSITNPHTARLAGQVTVHLRTTLEAGSRLALNGVFLIQLGDRLTNDGTIDGSTPSSRLSFAGVAPTLYQGSGVMGAHNAPLQGLDLDNPGGLVLDPAVPEIITLGVRLLSGTITNSPKIHLGIGGTSQVRIQLGSTGTPTAGGHFDVSPTFELGSLGCLLLYEKETGLRVVGPEVPPSRSVAYIEVNNPNGVKLTGGDLSTTGTLSLISGVFATGPFTAIIGAGATLTRVAGWVAGHLRKDVPAGASVTRTFEVGGVPGYAPVTITFTNVTAGVLTVGAWASDHPEILHSGLDPLASVNQSWSLSSPGIAFTSYAATFNFSAADVDPGADPSRFVVRRYDGADWSPEPHGPRTATSTRATGVTALGDFALGEQSVTVLAPNGGEVLSVGDAAALMWAIDDSSTVTAVDLAVSRDGGATYDPIVSLPGAGGGHYAWVVAAPGTNPDRDTIYTARFRVIARDATGPTGSDASDAGFAIYDVSTDVMLPRFELEALSAGVEVRWRLAEPDLYTEVRIERAEAASGPWAVIMGVRHEEGGTTVMLDRDVVAGATYFYRLTATATTGEPIRFESASLTIPSGATSFAIAPPAPNPSAGEVAFHYSVSRTAPVRLSIVDLTGREVAVIEEGLRSPGDHRATWNGRIGTAEAPTGVYFVVCRTPSGSVSRRLVLSR